MMNTSAVPTIETETLEYWQEGAIAHLRFNCPQTRNAINVQMAREFAHVCEHLCTADGIRAVWIRGAGRSFMAGGNLVAMQANPQAVAAELIAHMHKGLSLLVQVPVPVVASVHGAVAGAGLGVMLSCDLVIAAQGTRFSMAYPLIGASSDCSTTWGLVHGLGLRKALELALLAEPFDAQEALRLSLVNCVVDADALDAATEVIVKRLAAGPTLALGLLKQLIRAAPRNDLTTQLQQEASAFLRTAGTEDFREGIAAFLDKRTPHFQGR